MRIRDIMSKPAVLCGRNETLYGAARLMSEHSCGAIPVVEDDGRIAGILTDRDICMAAYARGKALADIPVLEAMSPKVVSCHADDFLESTVWLMADSRVRRLPVVDENNRPIGVVSFSDLVRHASTLVHGEGIEYDVIKGFAALSRARQETPAPQQVRRRGIPRQGRPVHPSL
jgi:CBS domain-containing protein